MANKFYDFIPGKPASTVLFNPKVCAINPYADGGHFQWLQRTAEDIRRESKGRVTLDFSPELLSDGYIYIMENSTIPSSYTAEQALNEILKILRDAAGVDANK